MADFYSLIDEMRFLKDNVIRDSGLKVVIDAINDPIRIHLRRKNTSSDPTPLRYIDLDDTFGVALEKLSKLDDSLLEDLGFDPVYLRTNPLMWAVKKIFGENNGS